MTSYADELQLNPAFRAFVEAQKGQAGVEAAALRVENEHQRQVIEDQQRKIRELEQRTKQKKGATD